MSFNEQADHICDRLAALTDEPRLGKRIDRSPCPAMIAAMRPRCHSLLILLVMRMIAEMAIVLEGVRTFPDFARAGLGHLAGFLSVRPQVLRRQPDDERRQPDSCDDFGW